MWCTHEENVCQMNTSVKLDDVIMSRSHDARLVLLNLPGPPKYLEYEENCILDTVADHVTYYMGNYPCS